MIKKLVLIVVVLSLVFAQAFFVYAFQYGAPPEFESLWRGFGVSQTEYSQFVFRTIKWWWTIPSICLLLLASFWPAMLQHTSPVPPSRSTAAHQRKWVLVQNRGGSNPSVIE